MIKEKKTKIWLGNISTDQVINISLADFCWDFIILKGDFLPSGEESFFLSASIKLTSFSLLSGEHSSSIALALSSSFTLFLDLAVCELETLLLLPSFLSSLTSIFVIGTPLVIVDIWTFNSDMWSLSLFTSFSTLSLL